MSNVDIQITPSIIVYGENISYLLLSVFVLEQTE
jgi:hypothetical protein